MGTSIRIMDLELDILPEETLRDRIAEYVSSDILNIIQLISLDYVDTYEKSESVREMLEEADLVLPGEKAILSSYHVDVLETGGMVVDYRSAERACSDIMEGKKCYMVLHSRKEARIVYRYLASHHPDVQVIGLYTEDSGITEEALINDINTKLPDVVIVSMGGTGGEEWILNNKLKINARLCVGMGGVMNLIIRENIHVPKALKTLHLGGVYTFMARLPYSNTWRKRIFQKKMDNYNSRKLTESADAMEELPDDQTENQK